MLIFCSTWPGTAYFNALHLTFAYFSTLKSIFFTFEYFYSILHTFSTKYKSSIVLKRVQNLSRDVIFRFWLLYFISLSTKNRLRKVSESFFSYFFWIDSSKICLFTLESLLWKSITKRAIENMVFFNS